VDDIYGMLLAQAGTEARFASQCSGCHTKAVDLVRAYVVRKGDSLYGRASERRMNVFLPGHGGLPEDEVPFFVKLLDRIEREVNRR
jgi:hypothetical protein